MKPFNGNILRVLLKAGADPTVIRPKDNATILHMAVESDHCLEIFNAIVCEANEYLKGSAFWLKILFADYGFSLLLLLIFLSYLFFIVHRLIFWTKRG